MAVLNRNRWFGLEDSASGPRTVFKFGKYAGQYLADVASTPDGQWYLRNVMLKFEDMRADVEQFIEAALDMSDDPVAEEQARAVVESPSSVVDKMAALKAKAKAKMKEEKVKKEVKKDAEVMQQRKDDAEW